MSEQGSASFSVPAAHPALAARRIAQAKFVSLLRPAEDCTLVWRRDGTRVDFECRVGERAVARGVVIVR